MNGVIVLQPHADKIINKEKKIEYRRKKFPKSYMNIPIYLLSKRKIIGIIKFTKINWFSDDDGVVFGHVVEVIKKYEPALDYDHPNGAQVFVKDVKIKNGTDETEKRML